jgi:nucleoside-diphosphate-sugar epimerase
MGYVHIDDVASSHILVYEAPEATGRYLCSSVVLDNNELVSLLAKRYPIFPVPRRSVAIQIQVTDRLRNNIVLD